MARPADLKRLRARMLAYLGYISRRYNNCRATFANDYALVRWIASMTAVEVYAVWERYAESRLVVALANHPSEFIRKNGVRGLKRVPVGLAAVLVRGGNRYFDFRSCADLIGRSDRLVGRSNNPFRTLPRKVQEYLDTLAAIRNCVVHKSDAALSSYKRHLSTVYGMKARPEPDEFLNAVDLRPVSPRRREPRLNGLIAIVETAIKSV